MSPPPSDQPPGLAWPDPDTGPTPPPQYKGKERDRRTRKPMSTWDRSKLIVFLGVVWFVLFWATVVDNPIIPVVDAFDQAARDRWWLLVLMMLEGLRQLHYVASEQSVEYHRFWTEKVFGGFEQRTGKINDWNRFRMARVLKWLALVTFLALVLGAANGTSPVLALFELPGTIWDALPFVVQMVAYMMIIVLQFGALFYFLSRGGIDVYYPDDIKTRFEDVWGQDHVVERVQENLLFLEDPESIEKKGGHVPTGILLYGPPGTGKTLMAEAVAGETGKPYVFVDPGAFMNMFVGVGILKVKGLFRKLRKLAVRYGGVIVFFDEADSLGSRGATAGEGGAPPGRPSGDDLLDSADPWSTAPACNGMSYLSQQTAAHLHARVLREAEPEPPEGRRHGIIMGGMGGGGGMGTLQALLTELSGLKKPRGFVNRVVRRVLGMRPKPPPKYRILVMMATNMPSALDPALLRPGRIDRIYRVGYPSKVGRLRTFEGYFSKVRHELTTEDLDKLATMTPYATGASIKDLVNESLILAIRDERETITWRDVIKAKQVKAVGPPEDVEYIERERHAVAVHEACHAVVHYRVRRGQVIDIATIEKGASFLGFVAPIPIEERFTQWRSEYEAEIMVSLASLAGERLFFDGDNSSGVRGDLNNATSVAADMEGYFGMGTSVAFHDVIGHTDDTRRGAGRGSENDLLLRTLGPRVDAKLKELLDRSEQVLSENRTAVLAVAHALETYKTVTGDDVAAIIDGRPGPLIDGTVYAAADFGQIAEEYHAEAIVAHKAHGRVAIPLPRLNGNRSTGDPARVSVGTDGTYSGPSPWSRPADGQERRFVETIARHKLDEQGPDEQGPDEQGPDRTGSGNGASGADGAGSPGAVAQADSGSQSEGETSADADADADSDASAGAGSGADPHSGDSTPSDPDDSGGATRSR